MPHTNYNVVYKRNIIFVHSTAITVHQENVYANSFSSLLLFLVVVLTTPQVDKNMLSLTINSAGPKNCYHSGFTNITNSLCFF